MGITLGFAPVIKGIEKILKDNLSTELERFVEAYSDGVEEISMPAPSSSTGYSLDPQNPPQDSFNGILIFPLSEETVLRSMTRASDRTSAFTAAVVWLILEQDRQMLQTKIMLAKRVLEHTLEKYWLSTVNGVYNGNCDLPRFGRVDFRYQSMQSKVDSSQTLQSKRRANAKTAEAIGISVRALARVSREINP